MKKFVFLICLLPIISFASSSVQHHNAAAAYQELCAKEQDPVKRQNYCHMLHQSNHHQNTFTSLRHNILVG